jgi:thiamine phosphate synthase YjbQ (UPF0047 family)
MRQAIHQLTVEADRKGVAGITRQVLAWVAAQGIGTGLLTLWCRHASALLTLQEDAAAALRIDRAPRGRAESAWRLGTGG